jgi:AraC-like DNA-binding protein
LPFGDRRLQFAAWLSETFVPTYTRSAALTNFASVAAELGLDAPALVREVGLPPRCLDEPDLKVPTATGARLLELAAARGREPAFGLRMAESRRLSNLGPLGLLIRDEPTLRSALEALVRHIHLHNEALVVRTEQVSNLVVIRAEMLAEGAQPVRQSIERVFGRKVEFGHEFNGIVCNAGDLDAPNPGADPVMARYTRRLLEDDATAQASMSGRVRQIVALLLPRGHCSVERVAQYLGMDRRTVARHLSLEGTTFSALVDQLRSELLERYLDDHGYPLAQIAALLGFSSPSSFSRWHRQQFGRAARERTVPLRRA